jgi:hypothetical protein
LHEAIHQQAFNRGLIHRLSPVPAWFNEGIATGFEGNGENINGGPTKVSARYGRAALRAKVVDWDDVVADDKAFHGDVLAGEAYAHAWSIHWFLVTKYRKQYVEYLKRLGEKSTLEIESADVRTQDFEQIFGKRIGQLQSEFPTWLEQMAKKQKVPLQEKSPAGHYNAQTNLAELDIVGSKAGSDGEFEAQGRMKNISHIRPMSYLITLETNSGTYAEWYLPNVPALKVVPLPRQFAEKRMKGGPGGPAETYRVKVKTAVPDSETGKSWQRGEFPIPVWNGN